VGKTPGKTPVPDREGQRSGPSQGSPREQRRKCHSLMGQVLDLRRLRAAYEAVRSNRGEPGVDGVTVDAFGADLEANLAALVVELRAKTYRPRPVRRVWIPKPDGGQRPLGIPTITAYCGVVQYAFRVPHREAPVPPVGGPPVADPFRASSSDRSHLYL
jgi:hypothetical protein